MSRDPRSDLSSTVFLSTVLVFAIIGVLGTVWVMFRPLFAAVLRALALP